MATTRTHSNQLETCQETKDERLKSLPDGGQSSADKARALLELLEGAGLEHTNAILQLDSDDEGSDDDDDDVDYMEDVGTFLDQKGDKEPDEREEELPLIKDGIPVITGDMDQIDFATPEIHHHRADGMVIEDFLSSHAPIDEAPAPAASEVVIEEEDLEVPVKKRSKKKKNKMRAEAVVWEVEVEDHTPAKQEPISPTSVPLPEDLPLPEDIPLPEDTRSSTPPENPAPAVAEELQLLPPTALEDEWALPDTSSKKSKKDKKKKRKGLKVDLEDDLPYEEKAVMEAVNPVPASDPSRFDAMRDNRPQIPRSAASTTITMGGAARVPRASHSPDHSKAWEREEGFGSHKTHLSKGLWDFLDSPGMFGREETSVHAAAGLAGDGGRPISRSSTPPRQAKSRGFLGRLRLSALNLSKRLVRALETTDQYDEEEELEDDLAFGDDNYDEKRAPAPGTREMPKSPPAGPHFNFMVLPPPDFPPPLPRKPPPPRRRPPRPPGDFETLLRNKIFKPAVELTTALTGPPWTGPMQARTPPLFTKASLAWRDLRPLGQFVAERDRTLREDLKDVELGVGAGAGGFNLDFNTKGILALLKPVQWINLWRSYDKRRVHVSSHVLARLAEPKDTRPDSQQGDKDKEKPLLMANPELPAEREHRLLHEIEHELMSSVKYQFGQSPYITVITYSEGSNGGDRVDSGAIALFKASAFAPRTGGAQATKLDLEARFQDIPGPICRILAREKNPNRFEIKRNGRSLSVKARGIAAPPRPGVVRVVKKGAKGAAQVQGQGKETVKEWERIGGSWRRALHILLDHSDRDREAGGGHDDEEEDDCPNEGLIATIPQMLALLHLRYRAVDSIPSTSVFTFSQPLRCDAMSAYVRRGVKLHGPPIGATHVGSTGTVAVLFSKESQWVREQLFWA